MRRLGLPAMVLLLGGIACETADPPRGDSSSGAQHVRTPRKEEPATAPECATLHDVVPPDLVAIDGDLLFHLDEVEGLTVTSITDPGHPRTIGRVPFVGTPVAMHVRSAVAWIAYVDWDVPGARTVVRAVDVSRAEAPRVIGSASRPGMAAGTALVGGVFYLMNRHGDGTSISAFRGGGDVALVDEIVLEGAPGALAASPVGLAAVTTTNEGFVVTWIDVARDLPGAMSVRGARRVTGRFPAWHRDLVNADEGQAVRLVACSKTCADGEDAFVRVIDFSRGRDDIRASSPLAVGTGVPIVRFVDDRLYVGDDEMLRVVDLHPTAHVAGAVSLPGTIAAVVPSGNRVFAVSTVGAPSTGIRVAVHDVDVRVASLPRLRDTVTFGDDWTWSRAEDDDRAVALDPARDLVALPFSTWRAADGRHATGAQLITFGRRPAELHRAFPAEGHVERVVFVKDHLLAIGGGSALVLDRAADRELEVW